MRLELAKIEEFRSCLSASVRVSHKNTVLHPCLPKYGPFDPTSKRNALLLAGLKQQLHCPHMKLDLRRHPKASLDKQNISLTQLETAEEIQRAGGLQTSTPASSKMAPMVDSEVASCRKLIFSRI